VSGLAFPSAAKVDLEDTVPSALPPQTTGPNYKLSEPQQREAGQVRGPGDSGYVGLQSNLTFPSLIMKASTLRQNGSKEIPSLHELLEQLDTSQGFRECVRGPGSARDVKSMGMT
jgi:hypothetical protein